MLIRIARARGLAGGAVEPFLEAPCYAWDQREDQAAERAEATR